MSIIKMKVLKDSLADNIYQLKKSLEHIKCPKDVTLLDLTNVGRTINCTILMRAEPLEDEE